MKALAAQMPCSRWRTSWQVLSAPYRCRCNQPAACCCCRHSHCVRLLLLLLLLLLSILTSAPPTEIRVLAHTLR